MTGSLKLMIAAVAVASAPLPALAQAWPATVVASAPQMTAQKRAPALIFDRQAYVRRPSVPPAQPRLATRGERADDAEGLGVGGLLEVDIPARDEWSDDQGFRVGPTKLAFKRRF